MKDLTQRAKILIFVFVFLSFMPVLSARAEDQLKDTHWTHKISGDERFRYEYKHDFDLNDGIKDNGSQLFHRFRLSYAASYADESQNPLVDIFLEGLDAQTGGYQLKPNAGQKDDFDLHQAYVNVHHNILGSDFGIKAGRQEGKYGKGRLIAAPSWSNRMRVFDGGILHYQKNAVYGDLLYLQDVKYDDNKMNNSRSEEFIAGFYGGYQKSKTAPLAEWYFLDLIDIKGLNDIQRYTVGARTVFPFVYGTSIDIEFPYQFGHTASSTSSKRPVKAYAYHIDITKNWEPSFWKPKLTFSYDEATGDQNPNDQVSNTFIPLYQSTHEPYGILDFFRWQNMRNPEMNLTFSPMDKIKIIPQADFFWLQSKFDNWYNSSGGNTRTKVSGDRGYYVGNEVSLRVSYDINKYFKWESAYAHFFPGGYVKDSGASDDVDWVYSQMVCKF